VVGLPKTIDNDLSATDFTFGFFSAVEVATRAMDDLRSTAESHGRVMVVECMGRHAGWITAYAGVAAGAEAILVPERPVHLEELCRKLERIRATGASAAIVACAEGARVHEGGSCLSSMETDEWGHYRTGGTAELVAKKIQELLGWEARAVVLGHLQRAGRPIAFDRIFALRLGARAARLVIERRFGYMAALQAGEVVDVPLAAAVAERKTLTDKFLDRYESFFLPISSP
jgi:6-phosphofructokinase 1